ncbi:hypothetical protein L1049_008190 [Liquidambar formosana]|uniref:Uncharacterized protein n=1 Tax=Liquidambar formosana TaxID=63359 RepID=A0AAP0S909_LIQFO
MKNYSPNKYNTEERHDNGKDILVTPSKVDMDMDKVDVIPSKSGSNRAGTSLKNPQGNQEEKPQSASSYMKDKIELGTSRKNAKRKLKYDTHVSALTREQKKKTSIVSPESMGFKRSRSGRLLLPTLDFWRNQMAVYDADRQITGIQKGLHVEEPSRGSKSVPQKKRRQFT